jgi:5-methylcytosine-specific restriction enzyme A
MYRDPVWRRRSEHALAEHRRRYGNWCPGYRRPPHPSADLTLDHVVSGTVRFGTQVLCRSCNDRKRHVENPDKGKPKRRR